MILFTHLFIYEFLVSPISSEKKFQEYTQHFSAIETKDTKGGGREERRKQIKRMLLKSFAFFLAGILPLNLKIYTKEKKGRALI